MNLNPLKWIGWIFHGYAGSLRDHIALLKSQNEALTAEKAKSDAEKELLKTELAECKAKNEVLNVQLEGLRKEIENLHSLRVRLKEQTELQSEIRRLQAANAECERLLRIKSIGF